MPSQPSIRPADPRFSCGPTRKRPGWEISAVGTGSLGRSHRAPLPKQRLGEAIERAGALLEIPADYRILIAPASDTGAFEAAMWSMLGARGVDVFSWDAFGERWLKDAQNELKLPDLRVFHAPYGTLPDLSQADPARDILFTWNATAAGLKVPHADWISDKREGLTFCDATSAAFAMDLPWDKLDVTTFSWQKCLGGEAQHGMVVLSPRARARLASWRPEWPVPSVLSLFGASDEQSAMFEGSTINTPSLLATEDFLDALRWAAKEGGLCGLIARSRASLAVLESWAEKTPWIELVAEDPAVRSNTSVTLKFAGPDTAGMDEEALRGLVRRMTQLLEREGAALDILPYPKAPPGLRIWCGPTIDADDIAALCPWLDWAYEEARE
ncbi:phosphoserine transaminase [Glycocaulis sp.]|uniref:phosphoserine transaminase n=1 Tax=Glycocaulis sp. TaxID=1969725 RepID=UPI003D24DC98